MNSLSVVKNFFGGLLSKPGDRMEAFVTDSGRQVVKLITNRGAFKHSATRYTNGTIVETIVRKVI